MRHPRLLAALTVAVALAVAIPVGHAQKAGSPSEWLMNARTLRVVLGPGTQAEWEGGRLKRKLTSEDWGKEGVLTFDSIDLKAGTARLIAGGVADVRVIATPAGLTFIEATWVREPDVHDGLRPCSRHGRGSRRADRGGARGTSGRPNSYRSALTDGASDRPDESDTLG